ncbi:hypothetical protein [Aquimarina sp. Aq78]|uniref:hypothetical protein n=1 Tax=Aquimarina sp. Aq78 TaxID=1191889 RepID=UPI000D0E854C|nr:hypothetical protein [Aquimarina sp. Aq78]
MKINSINLGFISAMILLPICAIYYQDFSILITFFFLLYLGRFILNKQVYTVKKMQRFSFLVNVCGAVIITFCFEYLNNTWYSAGQDDFAFYSIANDFSKGIRDFDFDGHRFEWSSVQYKLYVWIFAYWYKLLNIVGIKGNLFFHLNIINSFVASFIAPCIYKIGLQLFGNKSVTSEKAAFFCAVFPPFVYYSGAIIRDTWIICFFLMIIYLILSDKKFIKKLILISILIVSIFYLRKSSAVFVVTLISLYILFNTRNVYITFFINRIVPVVTLMILMVFFIAMQLPTPKIAPSNTDILNYINYTTNYYRDLATSESVQNSIGLRLRLSNNPIVLLVYYIYFYFSPIPPKFIKDFNIINLYLGIGNILWYVLSPLYFIHTIQLKNDVKNKIFVRAYFWFLIIVLIMVGTATGEQRHLLLIYPIVLLFSIDYIVNHKNQFYKYLLIFFFLSLFGVLIYALLKMLI